MTNKALERPSVDFFAKQNQKQPREVDKYKQWLDKEDDKLLGYIDSLAVAAANAKQGNKPFKKPNLKGFELRYYKERMDTELRYLENLALIEAAYQAGDINSYEYQEEIEHLTRS